MATVNKASLRTEFDALKARFESLCAEGKMSPESRALERDAEPYCDFTRLPWLPHPSTQTTVGCIVQIVDVSFVLSNSHVLAVEYP